MSTFGHFNNNDDRKKKIGMHKLLSMKRENEREFELHYFDKNRIQIQFRDTFEIRRIIYGCDITLLKM